MVTCVDNVEGANVAESIDAGFHYMHHNVSRDEDRAIVVVQIEASHRQIDVLLNKARIIRVLAALETSLCDWAHTALLPKSA